MEGLNHIKGYRITKYNPEYRNEEGHYKLDTWTEYSDLGKVFSDKVFEMDEYLLVEGMYISVIECILNTFRLHSVILIRFHKLEYDEDELLAYDSNIADQYKKLPDLDSITKISIKNLNQLLTLKLRGLIDFDIIIDENNAILFGYDFYMYLNSNLNQKAIKVLEEEICKIGLYFEY